MKKTKDNLKMLKKLGFSLDIEGYYIDKHGHKILIENIKNIQFLMHLIVREEYNKGYDDALNKNKRRYQKRY
jgi:hypothetical protein